jgi:hypothetical protein
MNAETLFEQLELNARRISSLVSGVTDEQARWKPDPETWSILEVMNHLLDEERQDFRVNLEYILYRPGEDWPPIDPQGWVTSRQYNQRDPDETLKSFLEERQHSLAWLRGLPDPDWSTSRPTPWGTISAGDMLAAWATHDTLHMRQLVELTHDWVVRLSGSYSGDYAGDW